MDALEQGQLQVSALEPSARVRVLEGADTQTAQRLRKLLQAAPGDRAGIVKSYQDVLRLSGDTARGKLVFEKNCSRCHMPGKGRSRLGPDLSGINNKSKEELLTSILDPSYSVDPRFTNYIVITKDGRTYDGVIGQETPVAIALRSGSEEGDVTLPRSSISEMRASSISLMPDGLEESMSKQDIANLIAYLRGDL